MARHAIWASGLILVAELLWGNLPTTSAAPADAMPASAPAAVEGIILNDLPVRCRDKVRAVVSQPTLHTRGPVEVFRGQPEFYRWLLDHPDRAVTMWRKMGARCTEISDRGNGRFGYSDRHGSDISWEAILRKNGEQIWYAEGVATPGPVLPAVAVRAVVVMRYTESIDPLGRIVLHHQAELWMQTDSRAAALAARLVGSSAPKLAEQCVGQMELFFSALVFYLDRHPERAEALLLASLPPTAPYTQELRRLFNNAVQARELPARNSYNASRIWTPSAD